MVKKKKIASEFACIMKRSKEIAFKVCSCLRGEYLNQDGTGRETLHKWATGRVTETTESGEERGGDSLYEGHTS